MNNLFDWMPFYEAFADKLRTFKDNRKALIKVICNAFEAINMPLPTLEYEHGQPIVPVDIDPFTVFGLFNKQIKQNTRIAICKAFIEQLSMVVEAPSSFDGLPVLNNQKATFYYFLGDRQEDDIDHLWAFFEAALDYAETQNEETKGKFVTSYNQVLSQKGIKWNITMALFWIRPTFYLSLDGRNRWLLQNGESDEIAAFLEDEKRQPFPAHFVNEMHSFKEPPTAEGYLVFLEMAKAKLLEAGYQGTSDFSHCAYTISELVNQQIKKDAQEEVQEEKDVSDVQAWIIAPGADACFLDDFITNQVIKLGWDEVGDLLRYVDKSALCDALQNKEEDYSEKSPKIAAGMLWSFCHEMREGDVIFLKKGMSQIVGRGIVKSAYYYDEQGHYRHTRGMEWTRIGKTWDVPFKLPLKTLSKLSLEKSSMLENILDEDGVEETVWFPADYTPGFSVAEWRALLNDTEVFTPSSLEIMMRMKDFGGVATCKQLAEKYGESTNFYNVGSSSLAKRIHSKTKCPVFAAETEDSQWWPILYLGCRNKDDAVAGSYLWKLRPELNEALSLADFSNVKLIASKETLVAYTKEGFLAEVFMVAERYDALVQMLRLKKNVILQGAPGVGKTFAAKRLAYAMMGVKDEERIEMVQFHQNYSYEDFVMGYKPEGAMFALKQGVFYRFCQKAASDPERDYFFIIDEINRGNMSKIFGELLMLIEKDYRGTSMKLAYSDVPFNVPKNVHLVGMMNTADRSLAMIDYALRRRFSFFDITPGFDSEGFRKYQQSLESVRFDAVVEVIKRLNREITDDKSLGKGFCIGHSYLCDVEGGADDCLKNVVEFDILPMLAEYWFDEMDKYERWAMELMDVFK